MKLAKKENLVKYKSIQIYYQTKLFLLRYFYFVCSCIGNSQCGVSVVCKSGGERDHQVSRRGEPHSTQTTTEQYYSKLPQTTLTVISDSGQYLQGICRRKLEATPGKEWYTKSKKVIIHIVTNHYQLETYHIIPYYPLAIIHPQSTGHQGKNLFSERSYTRSFGDTVCSG